jgi:hypothetical protein
MCERCGEEPATDVDELCDPCGEMDAIADAIRARANTPEASHE